MTTGQHPNTRPAAAPDGEEPLPSFTEQMADQDQMTGRRHRYKFSESFYNT